jgi:hypothetical protein
MIFFYWPYFDRFCIYVQNLKFKNELTFYEKFLLGKTLLLQTVRETARVKS